MTKTELLIKDGKTYSPSVPKGKLARMLEVLVAFAKADCLSRGVCKIMDPCPCDACKALAEVERIAGE